MIRVEEKDKVKADTWWTRLCLGPCAGFKLMPWPGRVCVNCAQGEEGGIATRQAENVARAYRRMALPRLKTGRLLRDLSQKELAAVTGVRRETISNIERGRHMTRPATAQKLATALRLTVGELAAGS